MIKPATCAGKRQHGRRRMSSGTHVSETTVCSFRREVSATVTAICEEGDHIVRDESCLHRGATAFTNDRQWASGSTKSTITNARQLQPLDRVTPSAGEAKKRRQPSTRHICDLVQEKWTDYGVTGLAVGTTRPEHRMRKGTEWRDVVLADLVRPTLEGLILACFDDAEGIVDCVDTRTDGRRMLEVKATLTVRTRESEHHIAQLCSSNVIGEKLKISSALCLTKADSEYLVKTASFFAAALGDSSAFLAIGPGICARAVVEGCSESTQRGKREQGRQWNVSRGVEAARRAQSCSASLDDTSRNLEHVEIPGEERSRTTLVSVLENHRIQDKIESATEIASELRHTAWIATRHREECEERANSMQVLDNATTDGNVLEYVKLGKKSECEIEDDEEHQVSAVSKMAGDEWKKLSDQATEPCQKKYEAAKVQYDRDPAIFLANGGTKEKGTAALRKETLQLNKSHAKRRHGTNQ